MDTIGLDLHKRESQLCIIGDDGAFTERRIVTSRDRFTAVLGDRAPARILLEASTESDWVARHLEGLGHTVIVADPVCGSRCEHSRERYAGRVSRMRYPRG
jgi:transposase